MAPLTGALALLGLAAVAYLTAAGVYRAIELATALPLGPLWDEVLKLPVFFVLLIVAMVILLVPLFHSDSDGVARRFSLLASTLLVVYVTMRGAHLGAPDAPLRFIVQYALEPLRASILQ